MSKDLKFDPQNPHLPHELLDWLTKPLFRFLRIEAAAGAILLAATITALVIHNSSFVHLFAHFWESEVGIHVGTLEFSRTLREWNNDGLMTLFFFLVALELKRELVLGELRNPRMAALSIAGALGGMLIPALVYSILQFGKPGQHGWGTVMATDTAFVIGCLALLGSRIPQSLRVFMLSLAIVDDIGAVLVVAIGYGSSISWMALMFAAAGVLVVWMMALFGIRSIVLYVLVGLSIWVSVDASGIHATVTGVVLGLMTPTGKWVSESRLLAILDKVVSLHPHDNRSHTLQELKAIRMVEAAARESLSPVERLENMLHPWVGFLVMPLFAFANAGVSISFARAEIGVTLAVFLAFAIGKPLGVFFFSWVANRLGIASRPHDLSWTLLAGGAFLAGIGFTMALFIANLAFVPSLLNSAKLGILLASVFSGAVGVSLLFVWTKQPSKGLQVMD